ncbi:uncharacterized protein DDB_G0287625-like [Bicyclus anynana]|uniref:Uncharacterized protein DDB_G0287625-like n=1 Tax=Bicyclus anynana TaxID=110368 RepID=A0A6J1PA61_BICAN|nr:uncharacterized protein DDB_G0287625-like [Bicyclus anynana]
MIWKIIITLTVALCVQGEEDAISEQRVVIHHQKSSRDNSFSHKEQKKYGTQDEYATAYPSYEFSYKVNDPKTRDIKGQHETREGDEVLGNYWLIEPNGRKRTVNYQANDDNGFSAIIDYTASLKEEQKKENVEENQGQDKNQGDMEKSKEAVIEGAVDEQIQDIQDESGDSEENSNPPAVIENNSSDQNESDNQEDEANYVSNIERVDINYDSAQSTQKAENFDNEYRDNDNINNKKENQAQDIIEKVKPKKPKMRDRGRNNNRHKKPRNSMRANLQDSRPNENNNKNSNKGKKSDYDKNLNIPQKNNMDNSGITLNKRQKQFEENHINHQKEKNVRKEHRFKNSENKGYNEEQDGRSKKYAANNLKPSEEARTNVDIPDSEETYEHRIRIYHPKNISPRPKE